MEAPISIGKGLPLGKAEGVTSWVTSYIVTESSAFPSWSISYIMSIISGLESWHGNLGIVSRLLLYSSLVSSFAVTWSWSSGRRVNRATMSRYILLLSATLLALFSLAPGQKTTTTTTSALDSAYTIPPDADVGQPIIPNVVDPEAINPQSVCPGYRAFNVKSTSNGFTADLTLAGDACNVYGNDIESLSLIVEYQAVDRLHVEILPRYIGSENYTWFILPEELIPKPHVEGDSDSYASSSDLNFTWSNEPTFSFKITRKSTGDILFNTEGSELVYEDQFIEFGSSLPENYNLYGLGEVIHGFRLGNNLTRKIVHFV